MIADTLVNNVWDVKIILFVRGVIMLKANISVEQQNDFFDAVQENNSNTVKKFLNRTPEELKTLLTLSKNGHTAIMLAVQHGSKGVLEILLEAIDYPENFLKNAVTDFIVIQQDGIKETALPDFLVDKKKEQGNYNLEDLIYIAMFQGATKDALENLLFDTVQAKDAPLFATAPEGNTPLLLAAKHHQFACMEVIEKHIRKKAESYIGSNEKHFTYPFPLNKTVFKPYTVREHVKERYEGALYQAKNHQRNNFYEIVAKNIESDEIILPRNYNLTDNQSFVTIIEKNALHILAMQLLNRISSLSQKRKKTDVRTPRTSDSNYSPRAFQPRITFQNAIATLCKGQTLNLHQVFALSQNPLSSSNIAQAAKHKEQLFLSLRSISNQQTSKMLLAALYSESHLGKIIYYQTGWFPCARGHGVLKKIEAELKSRHVDEATINQAFGKEQNSNEQDSHSCRKQ